MSEPGRLSPEAEQRIAARLLDVFIRAGLLLALAMFCYRVFAPFLTLTAWAVILAVALYPLHQALAARMWRKQGLASAVLVLLGLVLIIAPTAVLMSSLGASVHQLIRDVQENTLSIPAPREGLAEWPLIGERAHAAWARAHSDLPGLVRSMQPQIGDLAKGALAFVAGIGAGLLRFFLAFAVAGILMAYGQPAERGSRRLFDRIAGAARGAELAHLSTATIRAVAQGVIGVALIQAILVGLVLLIAGVPWAGALAGICLVLGIAQVPALLVTLPAVAYLWVGGGYGSGEAILYTVLLLVAGMADNVLKPLLLGRGVEAPMPVILLGALGGMAAAGILGLFVGATLLALGYQILMGWVAADPDAEAPPDPSPAAPPA